MNFNFSIEHLGPIRGAQLQIKPLTVFVGPNGTGKTLAAYAFSAGMCDWYSERITGKMREKRLPVDFEPIRSLVAELAGEAHRTGASSVDLVNWGEQWLVPMLQARIAFLPESLPLFMATDRLDVSRTRLSLEIPSQEEPLAEALRDKSYEWEMGETENGQPLIRVDKREGADSFVVLYAGKDKIPVPQLEELVLEQLQKLLVPFPDTVFFPISRAASLELFPGGTRPHRAGGTESKQRERASTLLVPWAMHLHLFSRCLRAPLSIREEDGRNDIEIKHLMLLPRFIEILLGGRYEVEPVPERSRLLTFVHDEAGPVDMTAASSMVKELASLALYLRAEAAPGDLVVIDEPEMNLHPEAQLQMMEFLAMMVNAGLQVIITTHSPYMLDHLMNLMKAARSPEPQAIEDKFMLKSATAFIPQEEVSVYLFGEGTASSVLDEDGQITLGTFGRVSDLVTNLFFEL